MEDSLRLLQTITHAIDDKLGQDIVALKVSQLTPLADYFVICSARNDRQVDAITEAVIEEVYKAGYAIKNIEGRSTNQWVLVDCLDVIVHIFGPDERAHYNVEKLWADAPILSPKEMGLGE
ncbi:ribosome silencing factor [Atopobacter sp. AH10]|uniref:ribosome silencing factor n=1 Tax=Atopobacter sp. AH10 TaxID=2315861 RepID=UPI000EF2817A|nr:ribosome silencing factor [Atopobacter sp. AH10]RLK62928.1 ribosome silencing factor [Atopobacter sp. AH10]